MTTFRRSLAILVLILVAAAPAAVAKGPASVTLGALPERPVSGEPWSTTFAGVYGPTGSLPRLVLTAGGKRYPTRVTPAGRPGAWRASRREAPPPGRYRIEVYDAFGAGFVTGSTTIAAAESDEEAGGGVPLAPAIGLGALALIGCAHAGLRHRRHRLHRRAGGASAPRAGRRRRLPRPLA